MKPIFIGKDEDGQPINLGDRELETHVHGIGASRTGKSKLVESIARQMIKNRQRFCLIDPHGFLYDDMVRWLAYIQP
jgi:DNA helicase HerA-like ATPase